MILFMRRRDLGSESTKRTLMLVVGNSSSTGDWISSSQSSSCRNKSREFSLSMFDETDINKERLTFLERKERDEGDEREIDLKKVERDIYERAKNKVII